MTPKPDSMFVQKSIYDFLEDFERNRHPVRWDPLISIYKKKKNDGDGGENDVKIAGRHDDEKNSVGIAAKDPGAGALASHSGLKSEKKCAIF